MKFYKVYSGSEYKGLVIATSSRQFERKLTANGFTVTGQEIHKGEISVYKQNSTTVAADRGFVWSDTDFLKLPSVKNK